MTRGARNRHSPKLLAANDGRELKRLLAPYVQQPVDRRAGRCDAAGANALAEALGRLPLALDHAAAYCRRTQMSFGDYAANASSLIAAAPRGSGYPRSVAATFNLSITQAVAQCEAAEALMAYLAQCAPERIPMTLVEGAIENEVERLQALTALAEVSLLKHHPFENGTPAVTVHRLVQAVARTRSETRGSVQETVQRLIVQLAKLYPENSRNPQSWRRCAPLTPHLLALGNTHPNDASVIASWPELLVRAAGYFRGRAAYPQAQSLLRDALAIQERALGREHPDTATTLNNLGNLLIALDDQAGARPLLERALAVRENVFGPDDRRTATTLNNLADLHMSQGDLAGARLLYERALAIREKVLGPNNALTATTLNNLALLHSNQGDLAGAQRLRSFDACT